MNWRCVRVEIQPSVEGFVARLEGRGLPQATGEGDTEDAAFRDLLGKLGTRVRSVDLASRILLLD